MHRARELTPNYAFSDPCHGRKAEVCKHTNQRIREHVVQKVSRADQSGSRKRCCDKEIRGAAGKTGMDGERHVHLCSYDVG